MSKDGYLKEAKELTKFAEVELKKAKRGKNYVLSRQVCEKGYLALLKIVDAVFVENGIPEEELPKTERGRLHFLTKFTDKEFRKNYEYLRHSLHIDGFHEGILEFEQIKERLQDLKDLIRDIEKLNK